jgi:hypothetical protein
MPIRLNLLAEAQAAEDFRRRDPVKRGIWLAALLVALMLVFSSFLQLRATLANTELSGVEIHINSHSNAYKQVLDNQKKIAEIQQMLTRLRQLASNRLLNGTLLNALQQTTVEDVQLIRLRTEQAYLANAGTKTHTNDDGIVIKGRPASATESIRLTLEGNDSSPNPGDALNKYKQALAPHPYFKQMLARTNAINLKSLSPPQVSPTSGKPCVVFTLECRYPEVTR